MCLPYLRTIAFFLTFSAPLTVLAQKVPAFDEDKLERLARSVNIDGFDNAIRTGSQKIYAALPAKGYRNGFAGVLARHQLVVNPDYSFTECSYDARVYSKTKYGPGCRVSLKLARRAANGALRDIGIRVEWARDLSEKMFVPNNSIWASHLATGNGVFEAN